jgi:hypothetical protein
MEESEIDFNKFKKVFPSVPINRLIEQREDIGTDDGCIHFMDKETKRVYSWNYLEGEWEYQEKCQDELRTTMFKMDKKII